MPTARSALLRYRVAATTEHDAALKDLPFDVIIDVGANCGQFSLAARHYHQRARIIAFEPLRGPIIMFRNIFANDARTILHPYAVGPTNGKVAMQISKREDSSSLLPVSDVMSTILPGTEAVRFEDVSSAPLSAFLSADDLRGVALLKIDVQGFELEVLKTAESLLAYFQRVYVEASFISLYEGQALAHEVIAFLQAHGFQISGVFNPSYHPRNGMTVQADLLFHRTA